MTDCQKIPLILEIQGHAMDYVNLIVALQSPRINLLGVTVTCSQCFPVDGWQVVIKILSFLGRSEVPVSVSDARGVNTADSIARAKAMAVGALPSLVLQDLSKFAPVEGSTESFLLKTVLGSSEPVTVLCSAPLANLATALRHEEFQKKLGQVVVQGGSLAEFGDVVAFHHNGKAESRFFWDPYAAREVFSGKTPLTLAPIDLGKSFAKFSDFMPFFGKQGLSEVESLVGQIFTHRVAPSRRNLSRDVAELCGVFSLLHPELFSRSAERLSVKTEVPEQGALFRDEKGAQVEVLSISPENAEKLVENFLAVIKLENKVNLPKSVVQGGYEKIPLEQAKRKVFIDHDGAVDDTFGLMMAFAMPHLEILGVGVTGADCFVEDGVRVTLKLLKMYGRDEVCVSKAGVGLRNNFPQEWRMAGKIMDSSPMMVNQKFDESKLLKIPTHEFMIEVLEKASEPITMFITGPMQNLARALTIRPDLAKKVKEVVAMGGAVFVGGNVDHFDHDGSAEWNVFTDAVAYQTILDFKIRFVLFSLDATNHVPLSFEFLQNLALQSEFSASKLLGFFMSLTVVAIPSEHYAYFLWDPLSAAYLGDIAFCDLREVNIVMDTETPSEGRTRPVETGGSPVQMAEKVDVLKLYKYILDLLKVNLKIDV